jgi:hypothetical protein
VRRDVLQTHPLTTGSNHVPDYILGNALPPNFPRPGDGTEDPSLPDISRSGPLIQSRLDPLWYGHGADVPAFADQIHYRPVTLADLDLAELQADQLRSAETTTKQHRQHGVVSLGAHALAISMLQHFGALRWAQPIAGAKPELFDASHPADPGREFRAEQACVGSFVRESSHGCELLIDGVCGETA